jgi:hypothetical protein
MTERDDALISIYESVKSRATFGFDEFERRLAEWDVVPLTQGDKIIGGVLIKGNELHVGYADRPTGTILRHIKMTLGKLLKEFGSAVTVVSAANERGLQFCLRLGFNVAERKNDNIYLTCVRCRYV